MIDSLELAQQREAMARLLLKEASQNPAASPCDDAWMTAAIFMTLLDAEREKQVIVERYVDGDLLCTRLSPKAQCQWLQGHYGGCTTA